MLKKFFIILIIILSIIIATFTTILAASPIVFNDITNSYWAKNSIDYVSSKGYMVGYGDDDQIQVAIAEGK